jgi:transcriptional regulator with XRE-family HTH domain
MIWTRGRSETFGRRLAAVRRDRKLTQAQLAMYLRVSRQAISRWENSPVAWVIWSEVVKCARILHCRADDLLAPLDAPIPPSPLCWPRIRRRLAASTRLHTRLLAGEA